MSDRRSRSPPRRSPSPPRRGGRDSPDYSRTRDDPPPRRRSHSPPSRGGRGSPDYKRAREDGPRVDGDDRGSKPDVVELQNGEAAYLLGRGGATKRRLSDFSGANLEIDPRDSSSIVQIFGNEKQKDLARLCIDITLQQRNKQGTMQIDWEKLEVRKDVEHVDVMAEAVGFVLGSRGATLRELEQRFRTFMFFNNDRQFEGKKRLYVIGQEESRQGAIREVKQAEEYKMNGTGRVDSWRGGGGGGGGGGYGGGGRYGGGGGGYGGGGYGGGGGYRGGGGDRYGGGGGGGGGGYGGGYRDRSPPRRYRSRSRSRSPPRRYRSRSRSRSRSPRR